MTSVPTLFRPWRMLWTGWAAAALCTAFLVHGPLTAAEKIYSNSNRFRIPFQFDAAELRRLQATEIQLFVSADDGGSWQRVDSVAPVVGKFGFLAPADGSYWFSVKTQALNGQIYPPGRHMPGLNVIVDTQPPAIQLQVQETDPGRVLLQWTIDESHLQISSLIIESRDPGTANWQPVQVSPQRSGQATWTVGQPGSVEVRASVMDEAGNNGSAQMQIYTTQPAPRPELPESNRPVADGAPEHPAVIANAPLTTDPANSTELPAPLVDTLDPRDPARMSRTSKIARRSTETPASLPGLRASSIPSHRVNSTTFRVGYEFENVGPSGIGQVELYISENNGEEWFHYGGDPDKTSPFVVSVPRAASYCFAFRISNGVGYVADPPQPGEPAEVMVIVDQTPPVGDIKPVPLSTTPGKNQVLIAWTSQDQELASKPVSLFYAVAENGPWELMTDSQESHGRYQWTVPKTVDRQVFLRMEVRDAAGNVARIDAAEPLALDRTQPRARVIGIESVQSTTPTQY